MKKIITWDLGATKCAAALVEYDTVTQQLNCVAHGSIKIRECNSLIELTEQIEDMIGLRTASADAVCIGAAGQYNGHYLHLDKGYPYPMNFAALAKEHNWPAFAVLHDYSPIVCATFTSYMDNADNIKVLNHTAIHPWGRRVAVGVGTGVGVKDGVLFDNGDFWLGTNEAGHIGICTPPRAEKFYRERHREFIQFLRNEELVEDGMPLTFENILAAKGIVRIHSFFDRNAKNKTAEEIGILVREGKAQETLAMFAWYLGMLVGTIQLMFMPEGGVWMTGGVLLNHLDLFDHPDFFKGIEASPAYIHLRQEFPLGVLQGKEHAFMGAAYYATKRLLG